MKDDPPECHECKYCGAVIRATKNVPCIDVRQVKAMELARCTSVSAGPIYRALQRYPIEVIDTADSVIEAAIGQAYVAGVSPESFAQFLRKKEETDAD